MPILPSDPESMPGSSNPLQLRPSRPPTQPLRVHRSRFRGGVGFEAGDSRSSGYGLVLRCKAPDWAAEMGLRTEVA